MAVKRRGDIIARLRQRIATAYHLGLITVGDRLPSSRRLARELHANERVILAAYRTLADEGLVEFRPRSGVYLASPRAPEAPLFPGFPHWALDVLADGLAHGIPATGRAARWIDDRLLARLVTSCLDGYYGS
jgi:DNA-binding transcriptional MocR family regulator